MIQILSLPLSTSLLLSTPSLPFPLLFDFGVTVPESPVDDRAEPPHLCPVLVVVQRSSDAVDACLETPEIAVNLS